MAHHQTLALAALALVAPAPGAFAASAEQGKIYFSQTCMVCHSAEPTDEGGAQGPVLYGLIGRTAGKGDPKFNYTKAIKASNIVWDAATLDTFLTNPPALIYGTAMAEIVAQKRDRDNLIAYFTSLPKAPPP